MKCYIDGYRVQASPRSNFDSSETRRDEDAILVGFVVEQRSHHDYLHILSFVAAWHSAQHHPAFTMAISRSESL